MSLSLIPCSYCNKRFFKDNRHINENLKLGHKFYCSTECQSSFKNKRIQSRCQNPVCNKEFIKRRCEVSRNNYCSRFCAATVNNTKFPKKVAMIRKCKYCRERMFKYRIYCSVKCKAIDKTISKEEIIEQIIEFYKKYGRIPLKREFHRYSAARERFGDWNNAIKVAGFKPNPVMFSDNCVANDGHSCDSVAEKMIDDYLYSQNIPHQRCIPYPESECTIDFKIGDTFVEYFGLAGEHSRYDELRKIKQGLVRKFRLKLVEIYPKDLIPFSKLESILNKIILEALSKANPPEIPAS